MKKFGYICFVIGLTLDRILYFCYYLPKIDKTFALSVSRNDLIGFYTMPIGWIGATLIIVSATIFMVNYLTEKD
jgi:hypothetical protein